MVGIQGIAIDRRREVARAGDIANVGFEIFYLIKDRRIIQQPLLGSIVRVKARVERHTFARAGCELPNNAIGQSLEMATGTALPAFAGETVAQRVGAGDGIEITARGKKHFRAHKIGFPLGTRGGQVGGLHGRDDGIIR